MPPLNRLCLALVLAVAAPAVAAAQDTLPGNRITNAGVVRANAKSDSVFINRLRTVDTVDVADFAAFMLAQIGAPPFDDSLSFKVSSDSSRIRIAGRLQDFPPDTRNELAPVFSWLSPSSVFVAEISMPQAEGGVMESFQHSGIRSLEFT